MRRVHRSIMVRQVIEILKIHTGSRVADLTFGEGGHSEAFLEAGAEAIFALDRDAEALENYHNAGTFRSDPRLLLRWGNASDFPTVFPEGNSLDGVFLDLGVSTWQVTDPERGFSFSYPGPLDMRMDRARGESLQERLERASLSELISALKHADLHPAQRLAQRLLERAAQKKLSTTADLAALVPKAGGKRHPATKLFLALRLWLNDELNEVERSIPQMLERLKVGGRLAVLTFHSTEDRLVKKMFQRLAGRCTCEEAICICPREEKVVWVLKKALPPEREEVLQNPRARSAKLRCVEKCAISD